MRHWEEWRLQKMWFPSGEKDSLVNSTLSVWFKCHSIFLSNTSPYSQLPVCKLLEWAAHGDTEQYWTWFCIFASFPLMFFYCCSIWCIEGIRFKQWAHLERPEHLARKIREAGMLLWIPVSCFSIWQKIRRIKTKPFFCHPAFSMQITRTVM